MGSLDNGNGAAGLRQSGNVLFELPMYTFSPSQTSDKAESWRECLGAAIAITDGEPDAVANMANVAALIWQFVPRLNWAGFYRVIEDELVLGPFIGKPACIRIALGAGVCGTAAQTATTQRVADVHAFPGHIACDAESASELVVPVVRDGRVIAVIDLDSPEAGRFDADDVDGLEALAGSLAARI